LVYLIRSESTYAISFDTNLFDNTLGSSDYALFQFGGAVYGPVTIKYNDIQNIPGPLIIFDYGGGTSPQDHLMNKNIYFENNKCTNVGGPFIHLLGTWGIWDPIKNEAVPAVQPVDNFKIRNNYFEGSTTDSKSVAIGNSWDTIESAVDLSEVEISGNTFVNCTAPEELKEFLGNVPLFFNNEYDDDVIYTQYGGISNIEPDTPQIRPIFEYIIVNCPETVYAIMRTGRNEDGQKVTIIGGDDTNSVIFQQNEDSFYVPVEKVIEAGDKIVFEYDTTNEKWMFKSFTPFGEETESTWYLADQLEESEYEDGDSLVGYDEDNPCIFSAYNSKPEVGTVKVRGEQGSQYVEIAYSTGTKDRGSPSLAIDLPEAVDSGTIVVDFKMLITEGTTWDWGEAGFGSNVLGSGDTFASKIIYDNGIHRLQAPDGWKTIGLYTKGQWYRYVLTVDLSLQNQSLNIYAPGDEEPSQHASYDTTDDEVKTFVIKPIAVTSGDYVGTMKIKDAVIMISY